MSEGAGLSAAEKKAIRERAKKAKAAASREADLARVQEAIAEMPDDERAMAELLAGLIAERVPTLVPKPFYGSPGWALDGKVMCFFQNAGKYGARYSTFGFQETAALDDGPVWPTSFAVTALSAADADRLVGLVERAAAR